MPDLFELFLLQDALIQRGDSAEDAIEVLNNIVERFDADRFLYWAQDMLEFVTDDYEAFVKAAEQEQPPPPK